MDYTIFGIAELQDVEMFDDGNVEVGYYEEERVSEQLEYFRATMPRGIFQVFDFEGD